MSIPVLIKGKHGAKRGSIPIALVLLLSCGALMEAKTLLVPREFPTIKSAVYGAEAGDVVLVGDGVYLETNIVVDKPILIKSESLFGAIVYGSHKNGEAIFVIRAAARIEGFILKGSDIGIEQRESPDVGWEAVNLAIFGCGIGISVNDAAANIGRASVIGVAVIGTSGAAGYGMEPVRKPGMGISTNDADGVDAARCLFVGLGSALQGYNHRSFRVRESLLVACGQTAVESTSWRPFSPATSRIELAPDVGTLSLAALANPEKRTEVSAFIEHSMFGPAALRTTRETDALKALAGLTEGELLLALGESEAAAERWRGALEAARRAGSPEFEWQALRGLARTNKVLGAFDDAVRDYGEVIEHVDRWLTGIPTGIYRVNFLEDKMIAYEELIGLLLDRHSEEPSEEHVDEAFYYAEKAKALSTLRASTSGGTGLRPDEPSAIKKKEAEKRISALQLDLQDPGLSRERKDELCTLLEQAEEKYHGLLIERWTEAGKRATTPLLRYGDMKAKLGGGKAVLTYFLGDMESFAFLADGSGLEAVRLPPEEVINAKIEPYLRFLQLRDGKDFLGEPGGRILFAMLVEPFLPERRAGLRKVVVCPDGKLHYLPFAALVETAGEGAAAARFWGERVEVSYAPSASMALAGAAQSKSVKGGRALRILAVGNSTGVRCDNRSRTMKHFFFPLTHVKVEVKKIARHFRRGAVTTLVDDEAGERHIKSLELSEFGIIHFATHGVLDDDHWWRSALLVGGDEKNLEDGFLSALEIAEMETEARLVVLSACRTGLGRLFRGEGIRGLAGAFMQAGAEAVLVSLWSVDDAATAAFMGHFYGFLAGGESPAGALRKTQARMIGSKYRNPFYWAPFVLIDKAGGANGN